MPASLAAHPATLYENENKMKLLGKLRNLNVVIALVLGFYFWYQFDTGLVSERIARFRITCLTSLFFTIELIFAVVTKQAIAKGVVINKKFFPKLHQFNVILLVGLIILSIWGAFYYS